jgi:cell division septation protein DedD
MEQFDQFPPKGIKEKNMYVLHLDAPRIVILCSVILGIIIISFLLGMNLTKSGEKGSELLSQKDSLHELPATDPLGEHSIIPPAEDGIIPPAADLSKLPPNSLDDKAQGNLARTNDTPPEKNTGSRDILTSENVREVIPPAHEMKKASSESDETRPKKRSDHKKTAKAKKNRVVEVSSEEGIRESSTGRSIKGHYAIQLAAFDSRTKADAEVTSLKRQSYDAYIDKTTIKGKSYFRVRIGPIASRKKAVSLLGEMQQNDKYGESYLIKE